MKILVFPSYITILELKDFSRRKSGYGYMTWDVARSLAERGVEVDLLTRFNITKGLKFKKVNILEHTWFNNISTFNFLNLIKAVKIIITDKIRLKKIPYIIFYHISMGYFDKLLKSHNYDLVHIHGIGYSTLPIIETCRKRNVKYIVTLHGLNSFSSSINLPPREKQIEKDFLRYAEDNNLPVSVVSTGVKTTILKYLKIEHSENFKVVPNGCHINTQTVLPSLNVREIYGISEEKKIMLCVGRIDNNKNQAQIVRAFSKLASDVKDNLVVLFVGVEGTNGTFLEAIKDSDYTSQLIFCGFIDKEKLPVYYQQSDFNIVASITEVFGLSIVEGFVYGVPCLTFADLDAVPDLYNEKAMLLLKGRTDDDLAQGINKMLSHTWDKNFIRKHSQKFSLEKMAKNYLKVFKSL